MTDSPSVQSHCLQMEWRLCDYDPQEAVGEFCGDAATHYGRDNAPVAIMQYTTERKTCAPDFSVMSSGLVINAAWPWLAASPDAIACDSQAGIG